jgi:hypothetical protein
MCVARNRTDELFGRVLPFAVVRGGAIDPLLQNVRRLEHHDSTRGNRQLGGLWIAPAAPAFFEISSALCFLAVQNPRSFRKCASRRGNATLRWSSRGAGFRLRDFHDTLLGNGTVPIWLHRNLMLGENNGSMLE